MTYRIVLLSVAALSLAACGHRTPPTIELTFAKCPVVSAPPEVPLLGFEFRPLPPEAPASMLEAFAAALTSDDVKAILHDFSTLKQREDKWSSRAEITNQCINPPAPTKPAKRGLWPFGRKQ